MPFTFTVTTEQHLPALTNILNHYILNTVVTFHKEPLTDEGMREKVFFAQPHYRSYTILDDEDVIGYCAVSPWKKQEAYRHTAEINIYLRHNIIGQGIGSIALAQAETFAKENEIHNLIAGLCSENIPSKRLFEKNGYSLCAHFKKVGQKFGRTLDTIYLQKQLKL
jgi:phosphinothricin acetyltransferase